MGVSVSHISSQGPSAAPFSCGLIQGCEKASAGGSLCPHTGLALLSSTLGGEPGTNQRLGPSKPLPWLVPLSFPKVGEHRSARRVSRASRSRGRSQAGGTDSGGGVVYCSLVPQPPSPSWTSQPDHTLGVNPRAEERRQQSSLPITHTSPTRHSGLGSASPAISEFCNRNLVSPHEGTSQHRPGRWTACVLPRLLLRGGNRGLP